MIGHIIAMWLGASQPATAEVEALRAWDSADLTVETAREHLAAAKFAGALYQIDPALLLGIAHHESRFHERTVTREPGHRVSCGPMTPTPQRRCSREELTYIGGYLAGARHYRAWLDHYHGSEWAALTAYIGGNGLVNVCRNGPWIARGKNICDVVGEFHWRARAIKRALAGAS